MSRESTRYHSFKSCTLAIDIRGLDLAHCVSLHPRTQTKDACINITLSHVIICIYIYIYIYIEVSLRKMHFHPKNAPTVYYSCTAYGGQKE